MKKETMSLDMLSDSNSILGERSPQTPKESSAPVRTFSLDQKGRMYATGKRKEAIARVWVKASSEKEGNQMVVNGMSLDDYFPLDSMKKRILSVFLVIQAKVGYSVWCTIRGGGKSGQADALRHGIAVALERMDSNFRPSLKSAGFLRRDSRRVERKKTGLRKARRARQFSKR